MKIVTFKAVVIKGTRLIQTNDNDLQLDDVIEESYQDNFETVDCDTNDTIQTGTF